MKADCGAFLAEAKAARSDAFTSAVATRFCGAPVVVVAVVAVGDGKVVVVVVVAVAPCTGE